MLNGMRPPPRPFPSASSRISFPLLAGGALALALAASGCTRHAGGPGGGGFQMPPMPVEVADVHPERVREQFHALGGIEAEESIEVTSEVSGVVKSMPFAEGRWVESGQLLAQLDDQIERAAAERATAQREQAETAAKRAEALAAQKVISDSELDDVRAALKVAQANEAEARARLEKTRIRAPWAGLTGRRRVSPGAYVKAGDVITEVARVTSVKVTFAAPERFANQIKSGVDVEVSTPAYPGVSFHGTVRVVDPIVDAQTRTVQLVARVPNPGRKLKPGMSANVSVTLAEHPAALVVPDEAIFAEGSQHFVFVVKPDSTVARTPIQTGLRDSSHVEVVHGLSAGDRVVSAGHQKLFPGAKVMPIPAGGMPGGAGGEAAKSAKAGQP